MKNLKDNFYQYDLKKGYVKLNWAYDEHQTDLDSLNRQMFILKQEGHALTNITDNETLLFTTYFDFLELQ